MFYCDKKFIGNVIKTFRKKSKIKQSELAEKIGVSHAEISRFENGLKPSFYFIPFVKMCNELGLDVNFLLVILMIKSFPS